MRRLALKYLPSRPAAWVAIAVTVAPLLFFGWMALGPLTLGNDYLHYPVRGPQSLRFYTGEGLEPMWYPHQTGGIPVGGVFYAQYFHLPAWLTSHASGFWTGDALRLVTARHLLLLALAQGLYVFAFRRAAGLGWGVSWLLSLVMVYNLRTLDSFRYAIALEAAVYAQAAGILGFVYVLRPSPWILPAVAVAAQLHLTCGYPILLPFLAIAALAAAPLLGRVVGWPWLVRRGTQVLLAALAGALLAAPNWMAVGEWMAVNHSRVRDVSLEWAGAYAMPLQSLPANLFRPWQAEVHSAFGGSTLLVSFLFTVILALVRERAFGTLVALALMFAYALGPLTPVFSFVFGHVPGFATLRAPGRILFLLPLLLVAALVRLRGREDCPRVAAGHVTAGAVAAGVLCAWGLGRVALAKSGEIPGYSPAAISDWWTGWNQFLWLFLGLVAAIAIVGLARGAPFRWAAVILAAATLGQTFAMMRHGTWTTPWTPSPARSAFLSVSHLPLRAHVPLVASNELRSQSEATATEAYERFIDAAGSRADCYLPIHPGIERGVLVPLYLSDRVACVKTREDALVRMRVDENCLDSGSLRTLVVASAGRVEQAGSGPVGLATLNQRNRVAALTPNLVTLEVETDRESVLVTPFPDATANWSGRLDGQPAPLLSVNAGFLGMRVPAGRHRVGIHYFSRPMVTGYRIALFGALAIVVTAAASFLRKRRAAWLGGGAAIAVLLTLSLAGYARWERAFCDRARREALLPHDYPALLQEQLALWRRVQD